MIIPQTPEQARQRDNQHALNTPKPTPAHVQVQELKNAILEHRQTIEHAGPVARGKDLSAAQRKIVQVKQAADEKLWAHALPEQASP